MNRSPRSAPGSEAHGLSGVAPGDQRSWVTGTGPDVLGDAEGRPRAAVLAALDEGPPALRDAAIEEREWKLRVAVAAVEERERALRAAEELAQLGSRT
ncbi:MAG: hypothetical protein ACR2M5_04485 [Nakamurella sp.]